VKKLTGRKRHILVDTLGYVTHSVVHDANIMDRDGARMLLKNLSSFNLKIIFADQGYHAHALHDFVREGQSHLHG